MPNKKIIVLSPEAAGIIYALGFEDQLIGRSAECTFPETIKGIPVTVAEEIKNLSPDIVIINKSNIDVVFNSGVAVIVLDFISTDVVLQNITTIGNELDAAEKANELIESLEERINIIRHKLKFSEIKPKTAVITNFSPLEVQSSFLAETIETAGGTAIQLKDPISFEEFKLQDPEVIIISPKGYSIQQSLQEVNELLNLPGWSDLSAVKNNRLYIADGQTHFNYLGMDIADIIELLAEILHPKQFIFGNEGEGWIKFNL